MDGGNYWQQKNYFQISMLFPMATNDFFMNNTMYTTWIIAGPFFLAYHANIKRKRIMITDDIPIQ